MFAKSITNSSRFLMMPSSSQNLYFHLGMNSDDDGFVEHFFVMRMTDSKPDDLHILAAKGFVHVFDDKVLVILDWKENNFLRSDRYSPSKYLKEYKEQLKEIETELSSKQATLMSGIPNDIPLGDLGKDRLGKEREEKRNITKEFKEVSDKWEGSPNKTILLEEKEKFLAYWLEKSPNGKKCRWEMERVFDIRRRWGTWIKNVEARQKPKEFVKTVRDTAPRSGFGSISDVIKNRI